MTRRYRAAVPAAVLILLSACTATPAATNPTAPPAASALSSPLGGTPHVTGDPAGSGDATATVRRTSTVGPTRGDRQEVTGIVLDVEGRLGRASAFTLRTDTGKVLRFTLGELEIDDTGFHAEHLREHRVSAAPVRVTFREEAQGAVAVRLEDAH